MSDAPALDFERLSYAWESGEPYDSDALMQPWEDTNKITVAWNSVGNGWACRIERAILVETSDGRHECELYETVEDAERAWPEFERTYGGEVEQDILNPPHTRLVSEDDEVEL